MTNEASGLSRRDLMKRGAVAGAVVWSAPVLMSSPAFAATTACGGSKPCTDFYYVKIEGDANATGEPSINPNQCSSSTTGDNSVCGSLVTTATCGEGTPLKNGCSLVSGGHTGNVAVLTFPAGSVPQFFQLKPGTNCYDFAWDPATTSFVSTTAPSGCLISSTGIVNGDGTTTVRIEWRAGKNCQGISHIGAYFCL